MALSSRAQVDGRNNEEGLKILNKYQERNKTSLNFKTQYVFTFIENSELQKINLSIFCIMKKKIKKKNEDPIFNLPVN